MSNTNYDENEDLGSSGSESDNSEVAVPQPDVQRGDDTAEELEEEQESQEVDPITEGSSAEATSWRVAKSLLKLREQVNAKWPNRSKISDGTIGDPSHQSRDSDHNPWIVDGNTRVVTALDITNDPAHGLSSDALAKQLIASKDPRIKYIISNGMIARSYSKNGKAAWVWQVYNGTNKHTKHTHISVKAEKASYDNTVAWKLG